MADDTPTADTPRERLRAILVKLSQSKVVPTLFITEAMKSGAFHLLSGAPPLDKTIAAVVMAIVSTAGWTYTTDEVGDAVEAVVETAEDASSN